jgi:hypothetical protein
VKGLLVRRPDESFQSFGRRILRRIIDEFRVGIRFNHTPDLGSVGSGNFVEILKTVRPCEQQRLELVQLNVRDKPSIANVVVAGLLQKIYPPLYIRDPLRFIVLWEIRP